MFRRTVLPLSLIAFAFVAFAAVAWMLADGNDLAAMYGALVALVALRAQARIAQVIAT